MGRKIVLTGVLCAMVGMLCSTAVAAAPMGPPTAGLKTGQFRVGVDYGYMEGDIDTKVGEVDGFESNTILANLGYGITDEIDIYGLIGASDGDVDEFDSSYEPAYGFGVKATLARDENVSWGVVYQMLWVNPKDDISGVDVEIDAYDIKAAVGPSYNANGLKLYGGPMLYYIDGEIEASIGGLSGDADIDQDVQIGVYAGLAIDLAENMSLMGEYQYTHDVETIGASLYWKF
ncbi:MAG: outer membrane beta-barrel protein [Sedimentisphaerales bacterium]|nr:outer membrane beta-barrel protein [Sedimentisphaerales bacterium]